MAKQRMKRAAKAASSRTRVKRLMSAPPSAVRRPARRAPTKRARGLEPKSHHARARPGEEGVGEGVAHKGEAAEHEHGAEHAAA